MALTVAPRFIVMPVPVHRSSLVRLSRGIVRDDDLIGGGAPPI